MTDDTIKISREMFRKIVDDTLGPGWSRDMRDTLEAGFFGPKKPREIWIHKPENASGFAKLSVYPVGMTEPHPKEGWCKYREVTDGE